MEPLSPCIVHIIIILWNCAGSTVCSSRSSDCLCCNIKLNSKIRLSVLTLWPVPFLLKLLVVDSPDFDLKFSHCLRYFFIIYVQDMYGTCLSLHSLCIQAAKTGGLQCAQTLAPPRSMPAHKPPGSMRNPVLHLLSLNVLDLFNSFPWF